MTYKGGIRTSGSGGSTWMVAGALLLAGAAAAVAKISDAPTWLILAAVAAAAVVVPAANLVKGRQEQHSKDRIEVRDLAAGAGGLVRDQTEASTRVHRAIRGDVPYLKRDAEDQAIEQLRCTRRLLIAGGSMSGKTRLALEVATVVVGDHDFYEPAAGTSLRDLWVKGMKPDRVLVWLDDLERFTGAGGLSQGVGKVRLWGCDLGFRV